MASMQVRRPQVRVYSFIGRFTSSRAASASTWVISNPFPQTEMIDPLVPACYLLEPFIKRNDTTGEEPMDKSKQADEPTVITYDREELCVAMAFTQGQSTID